MKPGLLKALMLIIIFSISISVSLAQKLKYYRIEAALSQTQLEDLMKDGLSIDHFEFKDGILRADVSQNDIKLIIKRKIKVKYLIRDIEKNLTAYNAEIDRQAAKAPVSQLRTVPTPSRFGTGGSYGPASGVTKHFTFQEMQNELDEMRAAYPSLITIKQSIGTTEEGRALYMVKLSDNADTDENEPEVFLNAVHHAREPISMTQLLFFMWFVLENYNSDKEIRTLVNSSEIYIVPCINPDGYVYNINANSAGGSMWRKNRRNNGNGTFGVDNNRNYGFRWGGNGSSGNPGSDTYRGTAPFSEKENQAIRNFANAHQFVSEFNFHSYGNYCIYPFSSVAVNDNPEIPLFRQLSAFLTEDNLFVYGNCQETLHYIADGEAADWAYGEQVTKAKMYGFTPEIGNSSDGFYPASSRILPLCNSMTQMNINLLKVSSHYGLATPSPPARVSSFQASIPVSFKNYSLYPADYTLSVTSSSPFVTNIDEAKVISATAIFQTFNSQFNFSIDPGTPDGTVFNFELSTYNGYDVRTDNISIVYTCPAPGGLATTGITETSANLSWTSAGGVTNYYLSTKPAASATWNADQLVNGSTAWLLNGLTPGTAYNWRVRAEGCLNYSAIQSFTTTSECVTPSPLAGNITSTGFTLNWPSIQGASSYTVETRLQGAVNWTSSIVTTNTKVLTSLSPNSTYEFQVRTNCPSGLSGYSVIQTVTTLRYCNANGNNNNSEWIDYVQLGSISRTSGKEAGGYINTGHSANLVRNGRYTLTFSAGFSGGVIKENWEVYIDYNNDGDFTDNNERIVNTRKSGSGNFTASFTVPANIPLSATRMRVIMNRANADASCGTFTYGEAEDYTINITAATLNRNEPDERSITSVTVPSPVATAAPNPFTNQLIISLPKKTILPANIVIRNAWGVVVYQQKITQVTANLRINTAHLSHGVYYLIIENGKAQQVIKMVK